MGKYKVVVYAIAKNEAKFADAWAENMSEADEIYVLLDPTSTDNTKEILERHGVNVVEKLISPWRFDRARNESLNLVPSDADICVCTDLDELFTPGWRKILEDNWRDDTNQAGYKYYHNAGSANEPPNIFEYSKIHDRNSFYWKWPVHEYIVQIDPHKQINSVVLDGVMLKHYPDNAKPRDYRSLLEFAVEDDPSDTRSLGLLIETYYNSKDFDKAKEKINHMLSLENVLMFDVCMAYKYFIQLEYDQGNYSVAKSLCYQALAKCDYCKVFYGELGKICILHEKDYEYGISQLKKCLSINTDVMPSREASWNDKAYIYDLISIGYFYLNDADNALKFVDKAIELNPNHEVYLSNKKIYLNMAKNK